MDLPLIAEAALNSCFQTLFRELHPILCSTEILKFWNIDSELDMLLKKVTRVQDLLNVAEERSQERSVSNWMVDLRELSYDMEDVVDEMNIERMRIEKRAAQRNQTYKDHPPITDTFTLWDNLTEYTTEKLVIKQRMNDVLRRLDEVLKEATELGLKSQTIVRSLMSSAPIREYSVPSVDEYEVYGRNANREHIIEKAFGKLVDGNLEKIGRKMVKKSKRVLLAVKIIWSFLCFVYEERWKSALRNELWLSTMGTVIKFFLFSYNHLPSTLKRCFEYLSLFHTDYKFDKDKLVRMWIVEGLIESKEERLLEDNGNDYYDELQRRCLIQKDGKMHDLVHRLACIVSKKIYCSLPNGTRSRMHMRRIRHLFLIRKDADLKMLDETKCLRTILRLGRCSLDKKWLDKIPKWSLLRVLQIGGSDISDLPSLIGNLKHLRYLYFSRIQNLPSSVCELNQ